MNGKAWIAAATLILSACYPDNSVDAPPADGTEDPGALASARRIPLVDRDAWDSLSRDSDPFLIDSAYVERDSLIVFGQVGGGCAEHVFTPYIRNLIYMSLPPGIDLLIHHEGNNDNCLALLGKRLAYGLDQFRPAYPGGFIYLNRDPDSSGGLRIGLPQAPQGFPLRYLDPAGMDSLAAGSDPLEILEHWVSGDTLRVSVMAGGGCREHGYFPYVSTQVMESHPPRVRVLIGHDGNEDHCKSFVSGELAIDVAEVRRNVSPEVVFQVEGPAPRR